jgi:hypothetical protein
MVQACKCREQVRLSKQHKEIRTDKMMGKSEYKKEGSSCLITPIFF